MGKNKKSLSQVERRHHEKQTKKLIEDSLKQTEGNIQKFFKNAPDHEAPKSRREFLRYGFWSGSAVLLGPSLDLMLSRINPAFAATLDCPAPVATRSVPFFHIHIDGGMHPLSWVVPRSTQNETLDNYRRLGLDVAPTFQTPLGNAAEFYDNQSVGNNAGFYAGLLSTAGAAVRANAAAWVIPWRDNGDGDNFPRSLLGLVASAGQSGTKLQMLGTENTPTGVEGGQGSAFNIASAQPLRVNNINSILNAVTAAGALAQLNDNQKIALSRTIQSLTDAQKAKIAGLSGGLNAQKLIECATGQNLKNAEEGAGNLNPLDQNNPQRAAMAAIWNNFQDTNGGGRNYNTDVHAIIAYNVLNGNAAGAGINIGGHDEHASHDNRQQQEQSSFQIGALVGRILATAELMNTKVMIQITQDGSVVNDGGTPVDKFQDDDNQGNCTGGAIVFAYNPGGPVPTIGPAQIGGIVKSTNLGQNARVDRDFFTADVNNAQAAVFYNYCLFRGEEAKFDQVIPNRLSAAQKSLVRRIV